MKKMAKAVEQPVRLTRFERARILGSRALQISQGAPYLVKLSEKQLQTINYNPIEIAKIELESGVLPMNVKSELRKVA